MVIAKEDKVVGVYHHLYREGFKVNLHAWRCYDSQRGSVIQHALTRPEEFSEVILEMYVVFVNQLVEWFKKRDAGQSVSPHLFLLG